MYRESTRPMSDSELDYVRLQLDKLRPESAPETERRQLRARRRIWLRSGAIIIGLGLLLYLSLEGRESSSPGTGLSLALLWYLAAVLLSFRAHRAYRFGSLTLSRHNERKRQEYDRWRAVADAGVVATVLIECHQFAEVLPNLEHQATYYFGDLGPDGIVCITSEHGSPVSAFELAGFEANERTRFRALGEPLRPVRSLRWSDFRSPPQTDDREMPGYCDPFPKHGVRYPIAFEELTTLLAHLYGHPAIRW